MDVASGVGAWRAISQPASSSERTTALPLERRHVGRVAHHGEVVGRKVDAVQVLRDGLDQHAHGVVQLRGREEGRDRRGVGTFGHGDQELLPLVLRRDERGDGGRRAGAEEDLALAVDDMFLEIHRHGFRGAEVLHGLGDLETHLLAQLEVGVDGVAGREDDGGIVGEVDVLCAEFPGRERLDQEKRMEIELCAEFFLQDLVGCEIGRDLLGYQDLHLAAN